MEQRWTRKWKEALGWNDTKKCQNCGLPVPIWFNFCPKCGRSLK